MILMFLVQRPHLNMVNLYQIENILNQNDYYLWDKKLSSVNNYFLFYMELSNNDYYLLILGDSQKISLFHHLEKNIKYHSPK